MKINNPLINAALVLVSSVLCLVGLEIAYRVYLFSAIRAQLVEPLAKLTEQQPDDSLNVFDPEMGYRYRANTTWQNTGGYLKNQFRINEHGLIGNDLDPSSYPVEKPPGEHRVALLGDSFAASINAYVRWPDLLQDSLNRSAQWRAFVGGKFTRVINFAMDGTGLGQWPAKYEFDVKRYSPDLVIVNFITEDIMRRFIYRGRTTFPSDVERMTFVQRRVDTIVQKSLPWYGIHSEVLAVTLGRVFGVKPRLTAALALARNKETHFVTHEEGMKYSLLALERMRCLANPLIILHHPEAVELMHEHRPDVPSLEGLLQKFLPRAQAAGFVINEMRKINSIPKNEDLIRVLYNYPRDAHPSDYGNFVYANQVMRLLLRWSENPAPSLNGGCRP